jgi:hypothetical protein
MSIVLDGDGTFISINEAIPPEYLKHISLAVSLAYLLPIYKILSPLGYVCGGV